MGIHSLRDLELAGVKWELNNHQPTAVSPQQDRDALPTHHEIAGHASGASLPNTPILVSKPTNISDTESIASAAADMTALLNAISNFAHPLKQFAKNTILPHTGQGGLLIITDTPSGEDDSSGKILSGAAGELLDKMLGAIKLARGDVSVTPLVFWRAPGGRTPSEEELALCRPFVRRMIEFMHPAAILTLGSLAQKETLNINHKTLNIFSIPHPNYLILKPESKKIAWAELQKLIEILENNG